MKDSNRRENHTKTLFGVPALVLGSAYTVLATVRGLGPSGIPVICPSGDLGHLAHSRWITKFQRNLKPLAEFSSLSNYLERTSLQGAVLIPCSDHWVREVAELPEKIVKNFPNSSPSAAVIDILLNKAKLANFLQEYNFPAPSTLVLNSEDDIAAWPEERFQHTFLKPCDSQRFNAVFKCKALHVHNREEAIKLYRQTAAEGIDTVLQEYIPGPASDHYFVDGFIDSGGQVRAEFARRRRRMYPLDFGDSCYVCSIPLSDLGDLSSQLTTLLKSMGYRGIFSAEFKHDRSDGQFKLIEINTRVWWQFGLAMSSGVNVVMMAYRDALGQPVESLSTYRAGVGWVAASRDRKAGWNLFRKGELTLWSWLGSWLFSTKELFKLNDPLPWLHMMKKRIASIPRRITNLVPDSRS